MKKLLVLPFLLLSLVSSGQNFEWVNQISGLNQDRIRAVATNSLNEIVVTGYFSGTVDFDPGPGTFNLTTSYSSTGFAAKYDSNNNLMWAVKFEGSTGSAYGYTCAFDSQNNVLLGGNMSGIVDFDPGPSVNDFTSSGSIDAYIVKLDSNGNYQWAALFGSSSVEEAYTLCSDENDNVYIGGYSSGTVDFNPGPGTFNLSAGGFICKLDSNGNFGWAVRFANTEVRSVKSQAGTVVSTGNFNGTVDFNPGGSTYNLTGSTDIYVLKLDTLSNFNWAFKITGSNAFDIEFDTDNNIYCNGYFGGTFDFDPGAGIHNLTANGSNAATYLLKLNLAGSFSYAYCFTGAGDCTGIDIEIDENKNVYSTGIYYNTIDFDPGTGIQNFTSNGNEETYICKTDSTGNLVWVRSIGSTGWDAGYGITVDGNSSVYIGGSFQNTVDFNTDTSTLNLTSQGNHDGFLMKLNQLNCSNFTLIIDSALNSNCNSAGYASCKALNGNGTISYLWNTTPLSTDSISHPTTSGIYTVSVTDSINCHLERSVLIGGPFSLSGYDLNGNLIAGNFRSGFDSNIWLDGFNDGCVPISGILSCVLDSLVGFNSSIPPPDLISGDTLIWNFTDLIYDSLHITPVINVTTNGQIGDTVCFSVMIDPISGDSDTTNNYKSYCFPVVNGYDPNDKQVYPQGECIPNYVLNGEPLTYTVRFQNTGNADAINIHILDTLDADLDLNSLRVIGNSHYLITEILPGNVMKFRFDNIHLPDSGTNELLSHGYVIYEVKPLTGTPDYTLIENTSHIYFDFNPAIATNTTENTLVDSIPTSSSTNENISVCYNSDYTLPDGTVYSNIISPVSHQSNLWMVDGCDSIITTNISVLNPIDTGVTSIQEIFGLESQANGMSYQWYDCMSQLPLIGQTSQILSSVLPSEYYVIITDGNCSDTSACYAAGTIGIEENQLSGLNIYPNPTKNILTISQESNSKLLIEIMNIEGRLMQSFSSSEKNIKTDVSGFAIGMYFINVKSEMGNVVYKLVKE